MDGIVVRAAVGLVAVVQALQLELAPGHTAASVDAVEMQLRTALELLAEHDRPDSSECGERNVVLTALSCLITSRRFMAYRLVGAVPTAIPIAARFVTMLQDCHSGVGPVVRSMSSVELETGLESLCRTNMSTAA